MFLSVFVYYVCTFKDHCMMSLLYRKKNTSYDISRGCYTGFNDKEMEQF